jgi:hypothetical protein
VRWQRLKPGLFGARWVDGPRLQLGCWWTIEFELIAFFVSEKK